MSVRVPDPGVEPAAYRQAFPAGRVLDMHVVRCASAYASVVDYQRDGPVAGDWYSDRYHFFDMSLLRRPHGAQGYFSAAFRDLRPLGDIFFAPAGHLYHGEGLRGRQKSLSLFIPARSGDGETLGLGRALTPALPNCLRIESAAIRTLLQRIAGEILLPGFAAELLIEGLGLTLVAETARLLCDMPRQPARRGGLPAWRMRLIQERVAEERAAPTLGEIAALCRLSRRQLIRAFHEETGQTLGSFVRAAAIGRARQRLAGSDQPVGEIATELGFATAAGFSTAFRRACGQSPLAYRQARRRSGRA